MISHNTKVNRLLGALAVELKDLPDEIHIAIHRIINDEKDGYVFKWCETVRNCKRTILGV